MYNGWTGIWCTAWYIHTSASVQARIGLYFVSPSFSSCSSRNLRVCPSVPRRPHTHASSLRSLIARLVGSTLYISQHRSGSFLWRGMSFSSKSSGQAVVPYIFMLRFHLSSSMSRYCMVSLGLYGVTTENICIFGSMRCARCNSTILSFPKLLAIAIFPRCFSIAVVSNCSE